MSFALATPFAATTNPDRLQFMPISGQTDAERELLMVVVFDEIEEHIDLAIAGDKVSAN